MPVRLVLIAICLGALLLGCNKPQDTPQVNHILPARGQMVFCPRCDQTLYRRSSGWSRTEFRPHEYHVLHWNQPIPKTEEEYFICPYCGGEIVDRNAEGRVIKVYFRDFSASNQQSDVGRRASEETELQLRADGRWPSYLR